VLQSSCLVVVASVHGRAGCCVEKLEAWLESWNGWLPNGPFSMWPGDMVPGQAGVLVWPRRAWYANEILRMQGGLLAQAWLNACKTPIVRARGGIAS